MWFNCINTQYETWQLEIRPPWHCFICAQLRFCSGLAELMRSLKTVYCGQFNLLALTALSDLSYSMWSMKHSHQYAPCVLCIFFFVAVLWWCHVSLMSFAAACWLVMNHIFPPQSLNRLFCAVSFLWGEGQREPGPVNRFCPKANGSCFVSFIFSSVLWPSCSVWPWAAEIFEEKNNDWLLLGEGLGLIKRELFCQA